jgi:Type VI secretion system (T6SS), amidase effector protein 4
MVTFNELWRAHPANDSVMTPCIAPHQLTNLEGKVIQSGTPVFANQCAIRLGVSLKRCGVTRSQLGSIGTCSVHGPDELHTINAQQLALALTRANIDGFGPMEKITGKDASQFYPKIFGRTGIIYIQDYWMRTTDKSGNPTGDHIDVWNGYRSSTKWLMEWFSWAGYYSNYAGAKEIWFWPIK